MTEKRPSPLMIRGVDPDLWHQIRVAALQRKLTVGELLNEILRGWLASASRREDVNHICRRAH